MFNKINKYFFVIVTGLISSGRLIKFNTNININQKSPLHVYYKISILRVVILNIDSF